jgi:hypothetical protein
MNFLFDFKYYLSKGIVTKHQPILPRAEFLINECSKSLVGLDRNIKKLGIDEFNANSIIKECHDIIIEMIRAKMFIEGFSASGNNAHEAEVAYMKVLDFSDSEVYDVNELRKARNSITYYGKIYEVEYAKKVYVLLKKIYPKLKEIVNL